MTKKQHNPLIYLFKKVWDYSYNRKKEVVLFIILFIIANCITLIRPLIIGRVFNSVQFEADNPELLKYVIQNLSFLVVITFSFWIFHGTARLLENRNAFYVQKRFRLNMFSKVMDLPAEWHKNNHSGDTIDKVNKAGDRLYDFSQTMFQVIESIVRLTGSILVLLYFDYRATLILLVFSIVVIIFVTFADRYLKKLYDKINKAENLFAAGVHDYISNIITVITLRLKKKAYVEMQKRAVKEYDTIIKVSALNEAKWAILSILISIVNISILILNAYTSFKKEGIIALATLYILFQYLNSITMVFYNFAWLFGVWTKQYAAVSASDVILDEYNKIKNQEKFYLPKKWSKVKVENINFTYKNKKAKDLEKSDIHNVSIKFNRNKRIALIGASGSGKSTLLSLLRGLHQTRSATVYVDNKKLKYGLRNFYNHIALIPQDPELFNATVEENISMGYRIKKAEIEKAVDLACFKNVLNRLHKGYKTNVMEKGVSLSGGEKQRLALARGLLLAKKYDFIFLDEPTSSVDTRNEIKIHENIFKHFKDKTIISSVHKLYLLPKFDYIYFFKAGKVIAEGNFKDIKKTPEFKNLWDEYMENNTFELE